MDTFELLTGRRTVHDFAATELPAGALTRALTTAIAAPNHRLTEPWRFVVAGPRAREQLVDISVRLKTPAGSEPRPELIANARRKMLTSAALVVVSVVRQASACAARWRTRWRKQSESRWTPMPARALTDALDAKP